MPLKIPEELYCPISLQIMLDPVIAGDGVTYEREYITQWQAKYPLEVNGPTGNPLINRDLIPNRNLKGIIDTLLTKHPELWDEVYVSENLKQQLLNALTSKNRTIVDRLLAIDKRFLTRPLADGQYILSLASNINILALVIKRLGDNFLTHPEVKPDDGSALFATVAANLGFAGAKLIAKKLKWQLSDIQRKFTKALEDGNRSLVDICAKLHADVNQPDKTTGDTPLHRAAMRGDPILVSLLLASRADGNIRNFQGMTPLHLAVQNKNLPVVEHLLATCNIQDPPVRLNLEIPNQDGETALHIAARVGFQEAAILLLKSGANGKARNNAGQTPAKVAQSYGNADLAQAIKAQILQLQNKLTLGAEVQPPLQARTQAGDEATIRQLGPSLSNTIYGKWQPTMFKSYSQGPSKQSKLTEQQQEQGELVQACVAGNLDKVHCLIETRKINAGLPDERGIFPLTGALYSMNLELIQYIYSRLNHDPAIMEQCIAQLPHPPQSPDFHRLEWRTLAELLADENNFEIRIYASYWLWQQNKAHATWTCAVSSEPNDPNQITIVNRNGQTSKIGERCSPSTAKYKFASPWHPHQIKCAEEACQKCVQYIDDQLALLGRHAVASQL